MKSGAEDISTSLRMFLRRSARQCGEIWIEEKTLQAIDRLIERGQPTRHVPTPLYDFALTGAK